MQKKAFDKIQQSFLIKSTQKNQYNIVKFKNKIKLKKKKPGNRKELAHLDKGSVQKTLTFSGRSLRSGTL